ncbi:MAG: hypothetical protein FJ279_22115 [Planctomycetes bacterium]|nr:hypothetical protein [Planctomycetota bacterium]
MKGLASIKSITTLLASLAFAFGCPVPVSGQASSKLSQEADVSAKPVEGFQLTARLEKEEIQACQPVALVVTLRNLSKDTLAFPESAPYRDYRLVVKDSNGREVPLTRYGKAIKDTEGEFRLVVTDLPAHSELRATLLVNRYYDMTVTDTYSVSVRRDVLLKSRDRVVEVLSNSVRVKITD